MFGATTLTTAAGLLMAATTIASPAPMGVEERQSSNCAPVHLLVARGTTEPPGDGAIGSLAQQIIQANPGATQEAIDYPASSYPTYIGDVSTGIKAVTDQFNSYTNSCPNSTVVLLGYSQGAQIVLDSLCGSGSPQLGGTGKPTITKEKGANSAQTPTSTIAAVVAYGDPGHVTGESWNEGTATSNGIFPRPKGACDAWADVIHSYCNTGDPFCARGNNMMVHLSYTQTFNNQASQWANKQIKAHQG
ncbi:Esterase [Aspergillus sclerotialis]|uniref:Esterase n=1 Tax=Aspergillus sclerotialis TaxID=2070753 RepID=A0A3A2ZEQ4_9EURO|nr:Esterase [Aspergillus sclerotialis]